MASSLNTVKPGMTTSRNARKRSKRTPFQASCASRFSAATSVIGGAYSWRWLRMSGAMADETQIPLDAQLEEIGAQLDWVRGYL
jgi:hypothetical protein